MNEEAILTEYLDRLADAIRSKTGKTENIRATNFASEIESIQPKLQSKTSTITSNTTTTIKPDSGFDGLSQVAVTTNISNNISYSREAWHGIESGGGLNKTYSFTIPASSTQAIIQSFFILEGNATSATFSTTTGSLALAYEKSYGTGFNATYYIGEKTYKLTKNSGTAATVKVSLSNPYGHSLCWASATYN